MQRADWNGKILELASCPNVHVKLGGLGMRLLGFDLHEGELPPSSEQLAAAAGESARSDTTRS